MIQLAFCSDKNYLLWCAVPALAAIKHSVGAGPISIHFILSEDCRNSPELIRLTGIFSQQEASIFFYFVDVLKLPDLHVSGHATSANYFRLLIPELLPFDIDKVIYLDCDLLVLDSLLPLWEVDLKSAPLAAVSNMTIFEGDATRLGIPYMAGTFNSGVLIMNLAVIRGEKLQSKIFQLIKEIGSKLVYWDQDVLNIMYLGRWLKLDNSWNVQHGWLLDSIIRAKYCVDKPKIIHFTGNGLKPWQSRLVPYSENYMSDFYNLEINSTNLSSLINLPRKVKRKFKNLWSNVRRIVAYTNRFSTSIVRFLVPAYLPSLKHPSTAPQGVVKTEVIQHKFQEIISQYFPSFSVRLGPFKGMSYLPQESINNCSLPKLAGSYEAELEHLFTPKQLSKYTDFFDIGCGDGYYAVGVATIVPALRVYAYDRNLKALTFCKALAEHNNTSNLQCINKEFNLSEIIKYKASQDIKRMLLLCDCDGHEASIFSSESYDKRYLLSESTIIIRSYEYPFPGMANHIIKYFTGSHRLERIVGVGDLLRSSIYAHFIPPECDHETASMITAENKQPPMEWLIFYPDTPE